MQGVLTSKIKITIIQINKSSAITNTYGQNTDADIAHTQILYIFFLIQYLIRDLISTTEGFDRHDKCDALFT